MNGKTVKVFLVDGNPNGVITAEIMNWTGSLTVAPRSQLADVAHRPEIKKTGVYILSGEDPKHPIKTTVYVGESDNVLKRLKQHSQDDKKEFWRRTVIITSKDSNLTKAHVRYLESRLIQVITQAKRAILENGTSPETTQLPEPDIADMEYFLEQVRILLPVLGFSFATDISAITKTSKHEGGIDSAPIYQMTYAKVDAFAQEIGDEFVVLEGSTARKKKVRSLSTHYIQMRNQLQEDGVLIDSKQEDYWIFTQNVPFASPSTAANVIGGASLNGRVTWKEKESQKTYAKWQEEQIEKITD